MSIKNQEKIYKYKDWRECISYPQDVIGRSAKILNQIVELLGMPNGEDRFSCLTALIDNDEKEGIINYKEKGMIRSDIGPNI